MIGISGGRLAGVAAFALLTGGALTTAVPAPAAASGHVRGDAPVCAAVPAGYARCNLHTVTIDGRPAPAATSPSGYGPSDLQAAYKEPSASAGAGVTVAIVDAYNDPNAASDLGVYRSQFGLTPADCAGTDPCFTKVAQDGSSNYPQNNGGWAQEESLDVDMVSAICPKCNILLVEATSNSFANLLTAEDYASGHANYISNSWGGGESSGETTNDSHFNKSGKVFTASTGDSGFGVEYPAASPFVTAAGGTTLSRASNSRGWSETAWSGAGSGCSAYEPQPSFQSSVTNITSVCSRRAVADTSADANPNTGVAVYDSFAYRGQSGWLVFGGTSVASPIIASTFALSGNTNGASSIYANPAGLFDVTSGSNGSCGNDLCNAVAGWDGPTGYGTPDGTTSF